MPSYTELEPTGIPHLPKWEPVALERRNTVNKIEADPNGISAHAPGAKLDAGKVRPSLIINGFARALLAVGEVGTFGANKYTENGWMEVQDGIKRYTDAKDRHRLKSAFELVDPDSNLLHLAHEAWNALAVLELTLRQQSK